MRLEETLLQSFYYYPTLFQKRMDVMNHMFLTLGNGYYWVGGELVDILCECREKPCPCERAEKKVGKITLHNAKARRADYSPSVDLPVHYCGSYSAIENLPKDLKFDWKAGIIWFLDSIIKGESTLKSYKDDEDRILTRLKKIRGGIRSG